MDRLRDAAFPVGPAMGLFFAVVGIILGNYGLVGLGVVVGLVGYFSKPKER
jgi:hypothetical protein